MTDDLWVTVRQLEGEQAPRSLALANGFSEETPYRVLGIHTPSEASETYFFLYNDRDEVWFVLEQNVQCAGQTNRR